MNTSSGIGCPWHWIGVVKCPNFGHHPFFTPNPQHPTIAPQAMNYAQYQIPTAKSQDLIDHVSQCQVIEWKLEQNLPRPQSKWSTANSWWKADRRWFWESNHWIVRNDSNDNNSQFASDHDHWKCEKYQFKFCFQREIKTFHKDSTFNWNWSFVSTPPQMPQYLIGIGQGLVGIEASMMKSSVLVSSFAP